MFFLVLATDKPGMLPVRSEVRPIHGAYLRNPHHPVKVHLGGPTMTTGGDAMNGTLLVVEAQDISAVCDFVADDPYSQAGVFQSVEIRPWAWTLGAPAGAPSDAPSNQSSNPLPKPQSGRGLNQPSGTIAGEVRR